MKKVLGIIVSGLAIGLIAGVVMISMNKLQNELGNKEAYSVEETTKEIVKEIVEETTKAEIAKTIDNNNANTIYKTYAVHDVSGLVDDVMPSVVAITNMQKFTQNGFSMFGFYSQPQTYEAPASGSGIIVGKTDTEVIIVTNNHVVTDSTSLSVTFLESETVDAKIKGTDSTKDLAIISVPNESIKKETLDKIKVARIGNSDAIKIGEPVVAIGNALGYGQTVTSGIVSAKNRELEDMSEKLIQTDATINPGNSGGPLFNIEGEVIGINVAKSSGTAVEGMGYAIPIQAATNVIETLSNKKAREEIPKEEQGYLGIMAKNIDKATAESFGMPQGVYVYKITDNSAAATSDLKEKDIIVSLDNQGIKTFTDLTNLLSYTRAGDKVVLKIKRLDSGTYVDKDIEITLGKRPADEDTKLKNGSMKSEADKLPDNNGDSNKGRSYQYDPFFGFNDNFFDDFFKGFGGW